MKESRLSTPLRWLVAFLLALTAATIVHSDALDQQGETHAWRGVVGQYTVVDFAASWCGPCWQALPRVQALADQYPDVRVLVISVDEDVNGRDRLVDELGLRVPVLWDEDHAIAEHYRPTAMPSTFLLGPNGDVLFTHAGSSQEGWETLVQTLDSSLARTRASALAPETTDAASSPVIEPI